MIKYLYCLYNSQAKFFTPLSIENLNVDQKIVDFQRAARVAEPESLRYLTAYYVGTWDDESCKFDVLPEPKLIFDLDKIAREANYETKS
ncbi:hypothetical protein [Capybara microvirus Cap3_SP_445]|nr:hypothetical protein [Capybara microvirus Cap3_SP_445]